jgi:hypothetical protein
MIFTLIKSKNRKFTIAFTFATLGLVYHIESILVVSFNSYSYYPKLIDDLFQDTVLGNIFSQVSISSTSALTIVYGLSFRWYVIFAFIYFLIEELFVKLGIYQHFWYKSIFTLIGFVPLFWFVKYWYNKLIESSKYYIHYITLYCSTTAVMGNIIVLPMKLLRIQVFTVNFYDDFSKNHTATFAIYGFFLTNILINLYRWRLQPIWKGIIFTLLFFIQYILYMSGIIYIKNGWFIVATLADLLGVYFFIVIFDRFLRQKPTI